MVSIVICEPVVTAGLLSLGGIWVAISRCWPPPRGVRPCPGWLTHALRLILVHVNGKSALPEGDDRSRPIDTTGPALWCGEHIGGHPRRLQVDGAVHLHAGDAHGHDRWFHHPDRPSRHL